jgi:hypothetical protein
MKVLLKYSDNYDIPVQDFISLSILLLMPKKLACSYTSSTTFKVDGPLRCYRKELTNKFEVNRTHEVSHLIIEILFQVFGLDYSKYSDDYSEIFTNFLQNYIEFNFFIKVMADENFRGFVDNEKLSELKKRLEKAYDWVKTISPEFLDLFRFFRYAYPQLYSHLSSIATYQLVSQNPRKFYVFETYFKERLPDTIKIDSFLYTDAQIIVELKLDRWRIHSFRTRNEPIISKLEKSLKSKIVIAENYNTILNQQISNVALFLSGALAC